jgi:fermentation-respiration switch protein FrsA (DUF1100 family)
MRIRNVLPFLLVLAGVYAFLCLAVFLLQGKLVFIPDRSRPNAPAGFEEVELTTSDGVRLLAWFLPAEEPRGALVFCHGNAGHIEYRAPAALVFRSMGLSVLLLGYRGYGASDGSPTEEGVYLDAEAAHDHLVARGFEPDRIVVYGESLGGAVATELARRRDVAGVMIESAFTSVPDMGQSLYPFLPVRWLARIRLDNAARVGELTCPLLLVHSPDDEIVPYAHARKLLALAPAGTELVDTEARHNDGGFLRREAFVERVRKFFHDALPDQGR